MSDHDSREEICPDCQAGPHNMDARVIKAVEDPNTGELCTVITWHTKECPAYTVEQIMLEEGVRRAKERDAWMKTAFPAAHERLKAAAATVDGDEAAAPFVAALLELVGQQGEDLDRFVPPDRWAEILDRHFPPPNEEPTT